MEVRPHLALNRQAFEKDVHQVSFAASNSTVDVQPLDLSHVAGTEGPLQPGQSRGLGQLSRQQVLVKPLQMGNDYDLRRVLEQNSVAQVLLIALQRRSGTREGLRHPLWHPARKGCAFYGKQPQTDQPQAQIPEDGTRRRPDCTDTGPRHRLYLRHFFIRGRLRATSSSREAFHSDGMGNRCHLPGDWSSRRVLSGHPRQSRSD